MVVSLSFSSHLFLGSFIPFKLILLGLKARLSSGFSHMAEGPPFEVLAKLRASCKGSWQQPGSKVSAEAFLFGFHRHSEPLKMPEGHRPKDDKVLIFKSWCKDY